MHPSSVNHQRFTSAAESGRQVCGYPVAMMMRIAWSHVSLENGSSGGGVRGASLFGVGAQFSLSFSRRGFSRWTVAEPAACMFLNSVE